ncbi:hypothetical protein P3W45_001113 [Vairimorpha bombi]|jgi:hypothetical protein
MYSVNILFAVFGFIGAIEVEFVGFNYVSNVGERKIVRERFDIFQGFSEETVVNEYEKKDYFFVDLDKELFKNTCIQRFKAYRWNSNSYSYSESHVSSYYVGTEIVDSKYVPTLVKLYSKINILMRQDESFLNEIIEDCKKRNSGQYDECGIWNDKYKEILIVVMEKSKSFKGDKFERFKFILASLLEEVYGDEMHEKLIKCFRDKEISEIYSVYDNLYHMLKTLNDILGNSAVIKKYEDESIKNFIESSSIHLYN